jgi:hypothetical protein
VRPLVAITFLAALIAINACPLWAGNDDPDPQPGFYQEYFNQLVEDWRLDQIREMARQWGFSSIGAAGVSMNRSFWEERLNLIMWLPRSNRGQSLVLEYHLKPRLMIRGELDRHSREDSAWLDLIFRTEY